MGKLFGFLGGAFAVLLSFVLLLTLLLVPDKSKMGGTLNLGAIPNGWGPLVLEAGSICPEIPPAFIAAQIHQESGWDAKAVSPVGAQGLSQFMPGTWQRYGMDGDGDGIADPFNPADAIISQGHYNCVLVESLKQAGFSQSDNFLELVLAAYNAGEGAVIQYGGIPPYPETQKYVASITALIAQYGSVVLPGGFGDLGANGGWPVNGPITSPYGYRMSPVGRGFELHDGIDFGVPCGTPVISPWDATVTEVVPSAASGGFGNRVVVDHGNGTGSSYSHLEGFAVSPGQSIQRGQIVGYVGNTGYSTGCHLHFSMTVNGVTVDPMGAYA